VLLLDELRHWRGRCSPLRKAERVISILPGGGVQAGGAMGCSSAQRVAAEGVGPVYCPCALMQSLMLCEFIESTS
jgi:hypothetical protein